MKKVHQIRVMRRFGEMVVEDAKGQLKLTRTIRGKKAVRYASGALYSSLRYAIQEKKGGISLRFFSKVDYARFIHAGVNGTEVNVGSIYSFKKKTVNTEAIYNWLKVKKVRLKKTVVNKYGQKVNKFVPNTEQNYRSAAFVIGRSVAQKGIVAVPFFNEAVERVGKRFDWKQMSEAVVLDNMEILK